jgi:2-amino-4-hydroxy-6-hydroxymethyldihydropteridine diphosphokinase
MEMAYLSLGSNLGNRAENLRRAIEHLRGIGEVAAVSSFYETEPVDVQAQPDFLNCAVALRIEVSAQQLLAALLAIEARMGRVRTPKKGARSIDLDILLFGEQIHKGAGLTVPHPAMQQRRFALAPMAEIAPLVLHPVLRRSMEDLLASLPPMGQAVRILR